MTGQRQDQVAVITGAGRGIGRGLAIGFAEQGARVVCCARTGAQIDQTVAIIERAGGTALAVPCDVTSARDFEKLYVTTMQAYGAPNGSSGRKMSCRSRFSWRRNR